MTATALRILIIGGYGVFGGRLVRLLADEPSLALLVAGRSRDKATAFCTHHRKRADLIPLALDRDHITPDVLHGLRVSLVVDASGPFQAYGPSPYRVVEATLASAIPYLDLADGTDFVLGIAQFEARARARGVFVLSGASTCPALSGAVVRHLAADFTRLDAIRGGISPSPYAGVGLNVVRAIAAYAGQPVKLWRNGSTASGIGLAETQRFTIAPPGAMPLGNRLFSLVDIPDLQILPAAYPDLQTIWMSAGPVPELWHRLLTVLARLVHWRLFPKLGFLTPLFHRVINTLRWGEARGGMFMTVDGLDKNGRPTTRSWHLIAEGDDGPFIPAMACAAIVRRMLEGRRPAPGARPAMDAVNLSEFERLFARFAIVSGTRTTQHPTPPRPLYPRILGKAWDSLPPQIRAMHAVDRSLTAHGRARVERGTSLLARMIAAIVGFPKTAPDVPVTVTFDVAEGRETWTRTFAGRDFRSIQSAGIGRSDHLIDERFGPITFGLAAVVDRDKLRLVPRRWSLLGVPMPRALLAYGDTYERVEDGRFTFHVEICLPLVGLLVRYRGHLTPATPA